MHAWRTRTIWLILLALVVVGTAMPAEAGLLCAGKPVTIVGTDADETINGTPGPDVIHGMGGNDIIGGLGGDDTLCGGPGQDRLDGGDGDDLLLGEEGVDFLYGHTNDDFLNGGPDQDTLQGGSGADWALFSDAPADVRVDLQLGKAIVGRDRESLLQIENVVGSDFDDLLLGDEFRPGGPTGENILRGGKGNDILNGRGGNDELDGEPGNDTLTFADYPQGSVETVVINLDGGTARSLFWGRDTLKSIENVRGSHQRDLIFGTAEPNVLEGLDGNDLIEGRGGNDLLRGGDGDDEITGQGRLEGESGNDDLAGGGVLDGGDDNDALFSGPEPGDVLLGGPGNDALYGSGGDTLDGGEGAGDTANYSRAFALRGAGVESGTADGGVIVNLTTGRATVDGRIDRLRGIEDVVGSPFDDVLIGDEGKNTLIGGRGDDSLTGLGGRNQLDGGPGKDQVDYFSCTSGVTVELGDGYTGRCGPRANPERLDTLLSPFERIIGSRFNDTLVAFWGGATPEPETLIGGPGDDLFYSTGGNDTYDGGSGEDTVSYSGPQGVPFDVRVDLRADRGVKLSPINGQPLYRDSLPGIENVTGNGELIGDDGPNKLVGGSGRTLFDPRGGNDEVEAVPGGGWLRYADAPNGVIVRLYAGTATGWGNDTIKGISRVYGSSHGDELFGSDGADEIFGGGGGDQISGLAGGDTLDGQDGNDLVHGGGGPDSISGGSGDDQLIGGPYDKECEAYLAQGTDTCDLLYGGPGSDECSGATRVVPPNDLVVSIWSNPQNDCGTPGDPK